ncbi:PD-(D/E)XK nuclease superfamily protein [Salinivibrio sp. IB872]|uniref:PD-(D/E)XK nuclease superfamily protein n=1 Tax=Salinivibrio sp. IB872 TaxID=1766123 RepID=UPI0009848F64|nr:PD-(D/E)XK nuclease superfamily protein [Salinivibrio sp. IB872]OOF28579.1 hypothetical protein BZJ18_04820 [Salinivibrio sp. IB872]
MSRQELVQQVEQTLIGLGFTENKSASVMCYRKNVSYPGLIQGQNSHAHFLVYAPRGTLQINVKFQQTSGTAIEKLAYCADDAETTEFDRYVVVCGGEQLLRNNCAINYLRSRQHRAPKLLPTTIDMLGHYLAPYLDPRAA